MEEKSERKREEKRNVRDEEGEGEILILGEEMR